MNHNTYNGAELIEAYTYLDLATNNINCEQPTDTQTCDGVRHERFGSRYSKLTYKQLDFLAKHQFFAMAHDKHFLVLPQFLERDLRHPLHLVAKMQLFHDPTLSQQTSMNTAVSLASHVVQAFR